MKQILLSITAVSFSAVLFAQPGTLDASFGTGGIVTTNINGHFDEAFGIALQPDGKILAAGYAHNGSDEDFAVVRYLPNGTPDNSFGTNGHVVVPIGNGSDEAMAVLVQPDGKIVLAGYAYSGTTNSDYAVLRLLANGTIDSSFGTNGMVMTDFSYGPDYAFTAALQADGKILVAGAASDAPNGNVGIVRYNTNGTLDNTFNGTGIVSTDMTGDYDMGYSMQVQTDGKIVVAGYAHLNNHYVFSVARYLTNGTLDNTFGTNGYTLTPVGTQEDIGIEMAIQADGKIVVGGYSWDATMSGTDFALVRYTAAGVPDNTFGTGGKVVVPTTNSDYARAVTIQPDGKIVLSGQIATTASDMDFQTMRFLPNGTLDNTFNGNGVSILPLSTGTDVALAALMQPDGKILIGGMAGDNGTDINFALVRYFSGIESTDAVSENKFSATVYPNPVAQQAHIEYTLTNASDVSVQLTDLRGRTISTVLNKVPREAGTHRETLLLPENLSAGMYSLILSSGQGQVCLEIVK